MKCFLTYLIFKNLWNNHWHVVLCASLKSRRERWGCAFLSMGGKICCQNSFFKQPSLPPKAFHFHCSLKTYLLTLMLKPRPPVACLRSTTVLCFRKWEFLIGKRILWTLKSMLELCGMNYKKRAWRPRVHLHLLGIHFHSCKPHPASVWLIPLWSISGRHHRYCWSPHCTAKQFQILSVGVEKNIDILPSRAIT